MKEKGQIGFYTVFFTFMLLVLAQMPWFISKIQSYEKFDNFERFLIIAIQLVYLFMAALVIRSLVFIAAFKFLNQSQLLNCYEVYSSNTGVVYRKRWIMGTFILLVFLIVYPYILLELKLVEMKNFFVVFYWPAYAFFMSFQIHINSVLIFFEGRCILFDINRKRSLQYVEKHCAGEEDPKSGRVSIKCFLLGQEGTREEVTFWLVDNKAVEEVFANFELVSYYERYIWD